MSLERAAGQTTVIARRWDRLAAWLLLAMLVSALPTGAATLTLPPINESPTGQQLTGKFVWFDLVTDDLSATRIRDARAKDDLRRLGQRRKRDDVAPHHTDRRVDDDGRTNFPQRRDRPVCVQYGRRGQNRHDKHSMHR